MLGKLLLGMCLFGIGILCITFGIVLIYLAFVDWSVI